jgi:hypothetical protein
MDDIIRQLVQQLGLSEEMAKQAVELVLEKLEGVLPEPIGSQLVGIMNGDVDLSKPAEDEGLLGKLGGLFGGKKE